MGIKLDMVGIVVEDMKRSLDFYRALGLNIPADADTERHVEAVQDGVRLAFDAKEMIKEIYGGWEEPVGHRVELAFLCGSGAELDKLYEKLMQLGYEGHKEPWDAFWGQRYAIVKDPDGNLISLFA